MGNKPVGFAGSAIAQGPNVGRIDRWSQWKPTALETKWLLLSGASDPPNDVKISKRRAGGEFLSGVTHDLANMEAEVGSNLFNTVKDLHQSKSRALEQIGKLFDVCKRDKFKPMLYYTGHGENGTGNWCFDKGTISVQEIVDLLPEGTYYPMIFSDSCYSGHWANFCFEKNIAGFHCLAACPDYSTACDTKGEGGDLTLFMTGKKDRPSTEPMYSGGSIDDYPISSGYDEVEYSDLISSHIQNSERILISQDIHDRTFSGCFATSKRYHPRPALAWGIRENYNSFLELVKEQRKCMNGKSKNIYSLACDENLGFGVFFIQGYGTSQAIVTNTSDIAKKWNEGFQITACAAWGSTFYVVMTKDTEEYKDKTQTWFTCNTWTKVNNEIQNGFKERRAITGICYSTGLQQYFVVMTTTPEDQIYERFDNGTEGSDWVKDKYQQGFYPTIIFKNPTDNKILVVVTKDKKRSDYVCRYNHKIK
ncbi:hypothetical protein ACROYT_G040717 [Oculina patagonica]